MIKLLIIDDEEKARHAIRTKIYWEINGIQVIGEAKNGLEAISYVKDSLPLIKDKYLSQLVNNINDIKNINQSCELFVSNWDYLYFSVVVIRIDNSSSVSENLGIEDYELMKFAVRNIAEETINKEFRNEVFEYSEYIIAILKLKECPDQNSLKKLLSELQNNVHRFLNLSITLSFGRFYKGINSIYISYKEAVKALEVKLYHGESQIISYNDVMDANIIEIFYPIDCETRILKRLRNESAEELAMLMDEFFGAIKVLNSSKNNIQKCVLTLLFSMYNLCTEMNIEITQTFGNDFSVLQELLKLENITAIKNKFMDILKKISETVTGKKNINQILESAIKYIRDNYSRDLNRKIVANEVYITPGYLSVLFKEEMGISFLDFLHKVRIQKACDLLVKTFLKTYEIASQAGYNDEKYFFQVFKKYTGMTPVKYRNSFKIC